MKILKQGEIPIYELHCDVCGTDFEAGFNEKSDIEEIATVGWESKQRVFEIMFTCPLCKATIIITKNIIKNGEEK